jgi:ATP-dependent Lon protease
MSDHSSNTPKDEPKPVKKNSEVVSETEQDSAINAATKILRRVARQLRAEDARALGDFEIMADDDFDDLGEDDLDDSDDSGEDDEVEIPLPTTPTDSPNAESLVVPASAGTIIPLQPDIQRDEFLYLPVVPVREGVLLPSTESVLTFGRAISTEAIYAASKTGNYVVFLSQRTSRPLHPTPEDMYDVGTLASIDRTLSVDKQLNVLARGIVRVKIIEFLSKKPFLIAKVQKLKTITHNDEESIALFNLLQNQFHKAMSMGKSMELMNFMRFLGNVNNGDLVDQIASTLNVKTAERQRVLETLDLTERMRLVTKLFEKELRIIEIEQDVVKKTNKSFEKHMRESVLRERIKVIQKELGEMDEDEELVQEYEKKLEKLLVPEKVKKKIQKELRRLKGMSANNPESGYVRTWLDTVFEMPWGIIDQAEINLKKAKTTLDEEHFGLKEVKDRVLEHMAVLKLQNDLKDTKKDARKVPTILCFVGAPGVGKTSIGRSIAKALGRKFVKVSLGGVRDESEIRGHRRTYVGAMVGRILSGMKNAGSMNPVFMLDEIDKLSFDYRGDPSAALLEVLDPEQNGEFEDHYLDMPFDLSQALFITTANTLDTIPPALYDRLEIIRYAGYTQEEKLQIAKSHLFTKLLEANGLSTDNISMSDDQLRMIIERYTQEAGVRSLEREVGKIMRKVARNIVEGKKPFVEVTPSLIRKYLGPEKYDVTLAEKKDEVGVATGLAWTSMGGDVLFIEVALTPGKGEVKLTGQLGDVMKESAQAALTYLQSNAKKLGISQQELDNTNIHLHVPEGAVPKDGPSAGITMATAMVSAFTKKPTNRYVAMTGEITLRGRVLRIGGLKEKVIAAHRAGINTIVIPQENVRDLVEIPDNVKKDMKFVGAKSADQVMKVALLPLKQKASSAAKSA